MKYREWAKYDMEIEGFVLKGQINDALKIMNKIKGNIKDPGIHDRFIMLTDTYKSMLKYSFELGPDPERSQIYLRLQQSILELKDDIKDLTLKESTVTYADYNIHDCIDFNTLTPADQAEIVRGISTYGDYRDESEANATPGVNPEPWNVLTRRLFYSFWLSNKFRETETGLLDAIFNSDDIHWRAKSLLVSAITLSMVRHFDMVKFYFLFDLHKQENPEIRQRAIIGLFLSLLIYQKRIMIYQDMRNRIKSIPDDSLFQQRMLAVLIQYIRACETEKITRKIQEEIVPEVLKIKTELEEKLHLNDLLSKDQFDEKNPEWENFFSDAPDVYQKLEQFSKMQIEGSDVFMGAFSMLKHFSFFQDLINWYMPFDGSNIEVRKSIEGIKEDTNLPVLLEGIEKSTVLCNSDKYSFCFNIQSIPSEQRKMMFDLMNMEMKAMNEMEEEELQLNKESGNKVVNSRYLQDLYRFFKLFPFKDDFPDIFEIDLDILDSEAFTILFGEPKTLKNLAEFYFAKDQFEQAIKLFLWLNQDSGNPEIQEKIGYCYQQQADYLRAINYYKQAEIMDSDKIWLHKKLAYCYRKIGDFKQALNHYEIVNKTEPDNLSNLAYMGQLHMDMGDFENALKYYYQAEYKDPKNIRFFRPIGWCSFLLSKYDTAIKYFKKVILKSPLKNDFFNLGHCLWLSGELREAIEAYRHAWLASKQDETWFKNAFSQDKQYLRKAGIDDLEVSLMIDYIMVG